MLLAQKTAVIYGAGGAVGGAVARFLEWRPLNAQRSWTGATPRCAARRQRHWSRTNVGESKSGKVPEIKRALRISYWWLRSRLSRGRSDWEVRASASPWGALWPYGVESNGCDAAMTPLGNGWIAMLRDVIVKASRWHEECTRKDLAT